MRGSTAEAFHAGKAAYNGLWAAALAREGFTSPRQALEGKRAFPRVAGGEDTEPERAAADLGIKWEFVALGDASGPESKASGAQPPVRRGRNDWDVSEQFAAVAESSLGPEGTRELLHLLWNIDQQTSMANVIWATRPKDA